MGLVVFNAFNYTKVKVAAVFDIFSFSITFSDGISLIMDPIPLVSSDVFLSAP